MLPNKIPKTYDFKSIISAGRVCAATGSIYNNQLVQEDGLHNLLEIKNHLHIFSTSQHPVTSLQNRRFHPMNKDIRNHINIALKRPGRDITNIY